VPALFVAVTTPVVALTFATDVSEDVKVLAVFALPVTVDENVNDSPTLIVAVCGVITMTVVPGPFPPVTVIVELAVRVGSCTDEAVMIAMPFFDVAVTTPVVETLATDVSDET
jgi:hypothetical protein